MNREKAERYLKIGLFGALLTLIGDCLIGAAKFPDGANMIEGYFAIALAMPAWRPILGGLIGFMGICLEFPGLMTIYPMIREKMPRGGSFYKLAMYVYLALSGGAVHLPCGVFMWIYKTVAEAAGAEAGRDIALRYLLYFLLPAAAVFSVMPKLRSSSTTRTRPSRSWYSATFRASSASPGVELTRTSSSLS